MICIKLKDTNVIFSRYTYQDLKNIKRQYHLNAGIYNFLLSWITIIGCCYLMTLPFEKYLKFINVILIESVVAVIGFAIYMILNKIFKNDLLFEKCIKLQKILHEAGLTKDAENVVDLFKNGRYLEIYIKNGNIKERKNVFLNEEFDKVFCEYGIDFSIFDDEINRFLENKIKKCRVKIS